MMLIPVLRRWVREEERWRWRAIILTVMVPDFSDALAAALATQRVSLDAEANTLAEAFADVARTDARRARIAGPLARLIVESLQELRAMPVEAVQARLLAPPTTPTGGGRLRGARGLRAGEAEAAISEWEKVWALGRRCLKALGIIGTVAVATTGGYVLYRTFFRSPLDKAREEMETSRLIEQERQRQIATCASNPDAAGCAERVNKTFDALTPSSCDILDTPLGSILGTLAGVGLGNVGMRKVMTGW